MDQRFGDFVSMFANYPSLQEKLDLKDNPQRNGELLAVANISNTNLTIEGTPPLKPPMRSETLPVQNQRPRRPEEDGPPGYGGRRPSRPRIPPPNKDDPFASPERRAERRVRRTNSESSAHGPMTEEEKRAREVRRRERERRYRERGEKDRDGKPRERRSSKPRRPHGLDLIDKLDVTGIYGSGRMLHH